VGLIAPKLLPAPVGAKAKAAAVVTGILAAFGIGYLVTRPRGNMNGNLWLSMDSESTIEAIGALPDPVKGQVNVVDVSGATDSKRPNQLWALLQKALPGALMNIHENSLAEVQQLLEAGGLDPALTRFIYDYEPGYPDWTGDTQAEAITACKAFVDYVHSKNPGYTAVLYLTGRGHGFGWDYGAIAAATGANLVFDQTQAELEHGGLDGFQDRCQQLVDQFNAAAVPIDRLGVGGALATEEHATDAVTCAEAALYASGLGIGQFYCASKDDITTFTAFLQALLNPPPSEVTKSPPS
jgi:hypothetical protein